MQNPKVGMTMLGLFAVVALGSGCGVTKSYVQINYIPAGGVQKVVGADAVKVKVEVADQRTIKDRIGRKGNEYSFLGPIIAKNDVAELVAKAIEAELVNRGFGLGGGSVQVVAELSKFHAEYQKEFVSEHIVGELVMQVKVKNRQGNILFAKMITGQGKETGNFIRTGTDTELALEKALTDAVPKLVDDRSFIDAVLKAAQP